MAFEVNFTETNSTFSTEFEESSEEFDTELAENGDTFDVDFGAMTQMGGVGDYEQLINKPQIEGVTLVGNKTFPELNLEEEGYAEINAIYKKIFG